MQISSVFSRFITIILISILFFSGTLSFFYVIPDIDHVKAASVWKQTSKVQFENGTTAYVEVKDFWNEAYLSLTYIEDDWTETTPTFSPDIEHSHAMAAVYGTDTIVLFGGFNGTYSNNTWLYDHSDELWNKTNISVRPEGRLNHALAQIDGTDKVLLFGGYTGIYEDDTWIYDYSDNSWTELNPSTKPGGRQEHSLASIWGTDKVLLFGGHNGVIYGDTWLFDLSAGSWTKLTTIGNPEPRYSHAASSAWGTDSVVLFGGWNNQKLVDTWIFDLSDNSWTENVQESMPYPRMDHTLVSLYGTDSVVLYSGDATTSDGYPWIYDLSANTWTNKIIWPCPTGRYLHAMANVWNTDEIVLFSGDFYLQYEDTWVLDINHYNNNGTHISESYNIGSDAVMQTLSWDSVTSAESQIQIQLRSAATEFGLTLAQFIGPDGETTSYYTSSPSPIWSGHEGDGWVQYKVFLSTDDPYETPRLNDITIQFNKMPSVEHLIPLNNTIFNSNNPTFSWNFSDSDSISQSKFQVQIDDDINFSNVDYNSGEQNSTAPSWSFPAGTNYTSIIDGKWYWRVRLEDNDGTWSGYSTPRTFIIDTHEPESAITTPVDNSSHSQCEVIAGTASDDGNVTDVERVEILIKRTDNNYHWIGSAWDPQVSWLEASGNSSWSYDSSTVNWSSGVRYIIQSRARDIAANVEIPGSGIEMIIDFTAPVSAITFPLDDVFLNELDMISGDAFDTDGAEVDRVEISIECNDDNTYWNGTDWIADIAWLMADGTGPWTLATTRVGFNSDKQYTIQSRAVDHAGNSELIGTGITFMFDNLPPADLSILVNDGDSYSNSTEIMLQLDSEDLGSGLYLMSFSMDGTVWSSWKKYNQSYTTVIPSGDGIKTVYFRVQDHAGNIADMTNDTIILDTTPPADLAITINDGADETDELSVILTLNGTDSASGIYQMSFSTDGRSWSEWEFYSETKAYTVPDKSNLITVYFKARDSVGNIAEPVIDSILYKTEPEQLKQDPDKESEDKGLLSEYMFLIPFILMIIVLIVGALIYTAKRRKRTLKPEIEYLPPVERESKIIDAETVELEGVEGSEIGGEGTIGSDNSLESIVERGEEKADGETPGDSEPKLLASAPKDVEKIEELFDFGEGAGVGGEGDKELPPKEKESKHEQVKEKSEEPAKKKKSGKSSKSRTGKKSSKSVKTKKN